MGARHEQMDRREARKEEKRHEHVDRREAKKDKTRHEQIDRQEARKEKTRHEQIDRQEAKKDKTRHEQLDRQEAKQDDVFSKEHREQIREEVRKMLAQNKEKRNGDHEVERPRNALNILDTRVDH